MTTRELIKLLEHADPTGESHIRMDGGIPHFVELKEGYWDGPYAYIDNDGNYVYSTKGNKVDLYSIDVDDFVEKKYVRNKTAWEDIEKLFKFELSYCVKAHRDEKESMILEKAKKAFDEIDSLERKFYQEGLDEMIANAANGWKWFQNKDMEKDPRMHKFYTWKIFNRWGIAQTSNVHNTESIMESGLWKRVDNNKRKGYFQWIKR